MDLRSFEVTTDRLLMRTVRVEDALALSRAMAPGISRWVASWPYPLSVEAASQIIEDALQCTAERSALPLVIIDKTSGGLAGWLRIKVFEEIGERKAELGYWLAEDAQSRGFMVEAATAALRVAFELLDVACVEAGAQLANKSSHRVLEKLGMRRVGERPTYSSTRRRWGVCLYWRLDRPAWLDQR